MSAANPSEGFTYKKYYWWFQDGGWTIYVFLNGAIFYIGDGLTTPRIYWLLFAWILCTGITELLRSTIIRFHWLKLSALQVAPRMLLAILVMGIVMATLSWSYEQLLSDASSVGFSFSSWIKNVINYGLAFGIWCAMYFLINTLENFRKAEIENLRWEALRNETELNRLKSQLNPHFMFNAMNVIRALVDENPARSKEAITQLSSLLRNTLQSGKYKVIPLHQEIEVVKDYLALESARMEERLRIVWHIAPGSESFEVPPLMMQTLVENCIKHGISKLAEGGNLRISTKNSEQGLTILLENSGYYDAQAIPESGYGLKNSNERLALLYNGKASLSISNSDHQTVITEVFIPKTQPS